MRSFWPGRRPQMTVVRARSSRQSVCDLDPPGNVDLVVHGGGHHQLALACPVHEKRAAVGVFVVHGLQRVVQDGRNPRILGRLRLVLVGDQFGLHGDADEFVDGLDDVLDRGDAALCQRHQPGGHHLDLLARRGAPLRDARQRAGAQVENPFVLEQFAVAHVERFVVDEQAQDLAVGDIDERLAGFRIAVARLRVGQRPDLVERVQVGARQAVRFALVEVAAQSDVAVGQREQRFGLGQQVEIERRFADLPRLDGKGVVGDHCRQQLREIGHDDVGAVASQRFCVADAVDADHDSRSFRHGRPRRRRARPRRRRPASGATPSSCAARRNESGAGLPAMFSLPQRHAVDPVLDELGEPGQFEHLAGVGARRHHRDAESRVARPPRGSGATPRTPRRRRRAGCAGTASFLRLPSPCTVSASAPSSGSPSGRSMPRLARKDRTPSSRFLPSTYSR